MESYNLIYLVDTQYNHKYKIFENGYKKNKVDPLKNIYKMDETGIFYHQLADRIMI